MGVERVSERYELHEEIASGGMASVHLGRLMGPAGFSRTVAIKRLHPQYAKDASFVAMFMDEARLAAAIQHPNVVPTLDVVVTDGELFHVMDYVEGASVATIAKAGSDAVSPPVAVAIGRDLCAGLHAAHEARGPDGAPLGIVHRDVSPQNVLVGRDGVARVLDFGVAKAVSRSQTTRDGSIKGKVPYMAPEQLRAQGVDRRADVYAAGVVLWELLAGRRLFAADDPAAVIAMVLDPAVPSLRALNDAVDARLEDIVRRALSVDRSDRFATADELREALEASGPAASSRQVGRLVDRLVGAELDGRLEAIERMNEETLVAEVPVTAPALVAGEVDAVPASPLPPSVPARSSRTWLVAAAMALAGLGGGLWLGPRLGTEPSRDDAVPTADTSPVPAAAVASVEPTVTAPTSTSESEPAPTATASASPRPRRPPAPPPARPPRTVAAPTTPVPTPPAHAGCTPPYTLDEDGIKTFKPWCLSK